MSSEGDSRNIVLTGFMGTGKSTVGKLLAARLNRVFYDIDTAIEHRTGLTIPRIFAQRSEPFFRAIEKGICHELALQENLVIATGGGALIDTENCAAMEQSGFIVCLTATETVIEARLAASDSRPLAAQWREIYAARKATYEAFPHRIETSERTPDDITEEILHLWRESV